MKNECDIVKDLLFSYNDGVLSATSKKLVEQHLSNCKNCKNVLKEIKQDNNEQSKIIKEIDILKNVKKKLVNKNVVIIVSVILLLLIIIFNILVFYNYNKIASTMEIYLKDNISKQEIEDIKNKITENSTDSEIEYISKEQSLERMKEKFEGKTNIINNLNEQNNHLPAFIEIKTNTEIEQLVSIIQDMPGIEHISTYTNINPYISFIYQTFIN